MAINGQVYTPQGMQIRYTGDPNVTYGRQATAAAQPFQNIVLHHTGANTTLDQATWYNNTFDQERGGTFGYHFIIAPDGTIAQTAPLDARTNHIHQNRAMGVGNYNSIGISLIGAGPGDMTPQQIAAAEQLVQGVMRDFGIAPDRVFDHGDIEQGAEHHEVLRNIIAASTGGQTQQPMAYRGQQQEQPLPPAAQATEAQVATPGTHTLERGETLWELADRYLGDGMRWQEIAQANNLAPGQEVRLQPGHELTIPGLAAPEPQSQQGSYWDQATSTPLLDTIRRFRDARQNGASILEAFRIARPQPQMPLPKPRPTYPVPQQPEIAPAAPAAPQGGLNVPSPTQRPNVAPQAQAVPVLPTAPATTGTALSPPMFQAGGVVPPNAGYPSRTPAFGMGTIAPMMSDKAPPVTLPPRYPQTRNGVTKSWDTNAPVHSGLPTHMRVAAATGVMAPQELKDTATASAASRANFATPLVWNTLQEQYTPVPIIKRPTKIPVRKK